MKRVGHRAPFGINLGVGAGAVLAAVLVAAVVPVTERGWRFGLVIGVVGGFAALSLDVRALAGVTVIAWLLVDGFLENRLGVLSWHGASDAVLLAGLGSAGAAGLVLGATHRYLGELRSRNRLDTEFRAMLTYSKEREKHDA